jgi:hypothetical protein
MAELSFTRIAMQLQLQVNESGLTYLDGSVAMEKIKYKINKVL